MAELGLKYLANLYTVRTSGGFVNHMKRGYCPQMIMACHYRKGYHLHCYSDLAPLMSKEELQCAAKGVVLLNGSLQMIGTPQSAQRLENAKIVSCADYGVPTRLKTSYLAS